MTCELVPIELTDEQKGQVCGVLSVGCDRQTAANFVGCSLADIRRAMQRDLSFAASVRRAEASVELTHMRNVQELAKDKKEWRASVWWLERRSPERFGRRSAGVVTVRQLTEYIAVLADILRTDVHSADDRQRVIARLESLARDVETTLSDVQVNATSSADDGNLSEQQVQSGETWNLLGEVQDDSDCER